jgi:hypothetical protein
MKFCPVVPEICRGQVHGPQKEERIIIIIIRRNGAKTISLQTLFGRLNNNKKRSKNNKSPKLCLGDLIKIASPPILSRTAKKKYGMPFLS